MNIHHKIPRFCCSVDLNVSLTEYSPLRYIYDLLGEHLMAAFPNSYVWMCVCQLSHNGKSNENLK